MQPLTWQQILASFVNCSVGERRKIDELPLGDIDWEQRDFLGWRPHRQPQLGYLAVPHDSGLTAILVRAAAPPKEGLRYKSMCSWCLTVHERGAVALFAAPKAGASGRQGNTVGTYACADLNCSAYVRELRQSGVPQPHETLSIPDRIARLRLNVSRFVALVLTP